MKSFNEMRTQIDEVLNKSDDMSKWISDFLDSDSPQFKGKSKEKRMQMAKAAYYAAQKEGVMQPNGTDKVGRLKEMKCWDGYKKQGTKIGKSGKVVNNCVKKEDVELDESTAALKKKAEKSGVSLSVLKKVYARGVAAWNSGHRPGTTPQQWGMARVNSYITKGKGTYHGADKDLREERDEDHPYHKGLSKSTAAKREAHWKKKEKLSDKNPKAYEPAPGDAEAKTKPSKHTKKYKELYGEMKNEATELKKPSNYKDLSYRTGHKAATNKKPASDNPHPKGSEAHSQWAKGHNAANKMNEADIPLSDKEKNKMLSNKDKSTLGKINDLMKKQKKEGYKSDAQRKAVWASRNEDTELDEISTNLVKRYKKAVDKKHTMRRPDGSAGPQKYSSTQQMYNRDKGERNANKRLNKEEVELVQGLIEETQNESIKNEIANLLEAANGFDPKAMSRVRKLAQMAAQHAAEKERMAKQHASEKERAKSQNESTAAKIVKTKLSTMAAKNVRIPSPEERRAEIEKRKQMQKEDIDMLSFDEYLEEDMRIAKATSMAKKHAGNMTAAVKAIDSIRKGLSSHPKVKDALKKANEELSDKQKKLDHNKNGKIDGDDLAKVRAGKTVNELSKDTLKSYSDKAHQDSMHKAYDAAHTGDRKESEKLHKQATKRADNVKKADMKASMKKEDVDFEVETKSYKEFVNEMQSGSYKHKGTRYGGSAQVDHDHESDFGIDNEKEKFKRLLQKKKPEQKPAQTSTVKRGRGRPMGSKSGARN